VYPNPTEQFVQLENVNWGRVNALEVLDVLGQKLGDLPLESTLDLGRWKGVLMLRVGYEGGQSVLVKIVR
ncbi:MAG: T9SS type A sorting domain-containing protein, partial [Flavobacteriales bacterium]|nr:T9SS type A sorting domain-containing protein [Flavobacteriales bacterium]